jgi:hypothetical protein
MTPSRLREILGQLGITQTGLSLFLELDERTVRRYLSAENEIPLTLAFLLELMARRRISVNRVREIGGKKPIDDKLLIRPPGRPTPD